MTKTTNYRQKENIFGSKRTQRTWNSRVAAGTCDTSWKAVGDVVQQKHMNEVEHEQRYERGQNLSRTVIEG